MSDKVLVDSLSVMEEVVREDRGATLRGKLSKLSTHQLYDELYGMSRGELIDDIVESVLDEGNYNSKEEFELNLQDALELKPWSKK